MGRTAATASCVVSGALARTALAVIALLLCTDAAAGPLRVIGSATIELTEASEGTESSVSGVLKDELGAPLGGKPVILSWSGASTFQTDVITDRFGMFRSSVVLPRGTYSILAEFPGDTSYDGASVRADASLVWAQLDLRVQGTRNFGDSVEFLPVTATVSIGDRPIEDVPVTFDFDCGPTFSGVSDENGSAAFQIPSHELQTDNCTAKVVVSGAPRFDDTTAELQFLRLRAPVVRVVLEDERRFAIGSRVQSVFVIVTQAGQAAPGSRVRLELEGRPVGEGTTNDAGVVEIEVQFLRSDPDWAEVTAFAAPAVGDEEFASDPIRVRKPTLLGAGVLALAAICVMLIAVFHSLRLAKGFQFRWKGEAAKSIENLAQLASTIEASDEREHRVIDHHTGRGIAATLEIQTEHETLSGKSNDFGSFSLPERWISLTIQAEGYLPLQVTPAPGITSMRVRLVAVRSVVRDIFVSVVEQRGLWSSGEKWWGRKTLEDVRASASKLRHFRRPAVRDPVVRAELRRLLAESETAQPGADLSAFEALALLLDEVYFSGRSFDASAIALAQKLAAVVGQK